MYADRKRLYGLGPIIQSIDRNFMLVRIDGVFAALGEKWYRKSGLFELLPVKTIRHGMPKADAAKSLYAVPAPPGPVSCLHDPITLCPECSKLAASRQKMDNDELRISIGTAEAYESHKQNVVTEMQKEHDKRLAKYPEGSVVDGKWKKLGTKTAVEVDKSVLERQMHILLTEHLQHLGQHGMEALLDDLSHPEQIKFEKWAADTIEKRDQKKKRVWGELNYNGQLPRCIGGAQAKHNTRIQMAGMLCMDFVFLVPAYNFV